MGGERKDSEETAENSRPGERAAPRLCTLSSGVQGGSPLGPERLCGCSCVYVWEISNDERIPFQVWAGGASTLHPFTMCTQTRAHTRSHTHTPKLQTFITLSSGDASLL